MKKLIISTLATVCMLTPFSYVNGQQTDKSIKIERVSHKTNGQTLEIAMQIVATGMEIECNGRITLEIAVEGAERRLVLPGVVYTGNQRYLYERRNAELSGSYHLEPYKVFRGIRKGRQYVCDYLVSVPYYTWMEHAAITWRECLHACAGEIELSDGQLVADINPKPAYVEPEIWRPDPGLFANLVAFLVPEVEEVKARAEMIELPIGFPVNVTEVRPAFGNNAYELSRADTLIKRLQNNALLDIRSVHIRGYASPEGKYTANERLARGRSEGFKNYLIKYYPGNDYIKNAITTWVPEDWEGAARMVARHDSIRLKDEALAIIRDPGIAPDDKERILQATQKWSYVWKPMLKDIFPKLRRIELKVDYTIQKLDDNKARELIYTAPEMLSLDEINRVARYYEPGSKQYREVYEIAAKQFSNDLVANNNAAAALLQTGDAEGALPYLEKTKGNPVSYINYGAYYYISGDLDKAIAYFNKAHAAGIEQAHQNLRLVNPTQK